MKNHSFTDDQLLNLVNNTITSKTNFKISDFTGGGVQITSTYNHKVIKHKIYLTFGYDEKRNSKSYSEDIDEEISIIWQNAILLKVKSIQVLNNGSTFSDLNKMMNCKTDRDNKIIDRDRARTQVVTTSLRNSNESFNDKEKDVVSEIISFLNVSTGKHFKENTNKTKILINARLKDGFTIDDFKSVIEIKCSQWMYDKKMNSFLRPETLFGTKFESYLNEKTLDSSEDNIICNW